MIDGVPFASRERSGLAVDGRSAEPAAIQPGRVARFLPSLTLTTLLTVFAVPNLVWVLLDRRVWPWDQAWYGEVTADLFFLFAHAPDRWFSGMLSLMPSKPPLLAWLGQAIVPLGLAAGSIDVALLVFVVVLQIASLALIWTACRAVAPRNLPIVVAATLFAAAGPLFIGLSHQYLVEPLQILDVSASLFVAIRAPRMAGFRLLALLALLTIVGMGSKTTTFIYCGLFWAIAFGYGVQAARQRRWAWGDPVAWVALAAAVLLGTVTAGWYLANMADMLAHIRAATEGADAELYGHRGTLLAKLPFWRDAVLTGFLVGWDRWILVFVPFTIMASAVLFPLGLWRRTWRVEDAVTFAASAHVVITIVLLAGQPNEETRFLAPLAPDLAVLLAWGLRAPALRLVGACAAATLTAQFAIVAAQSLGWPVSTATSAWLLPVNLDRSDRITLHDLVLATCPASAADRINVVGPEYPQLNANSLAFFAAKERLMSGHRCSYTSLGYAENDVGRALARVKGMHTHDVILPQRSALPANPDPFNMALLGTQAAVASSPDFTKAGQVARYEIFEQKDAP